LNFCAFKMAMLSACALNIITQVFDIAWQVPVAQK
jgi:hypothetical protein